ncbi:hypothetical protein ACFL0Y_02960 [Patescibacteria group bacterium]
MNERHKVGLTEFTYPASSFQSLESRTQKAKKAEAEFVEVFPGYRDWVSSFSKKTSQAELPVVLIHQDWWHDRREEASRRGSHYEVGPSDLKTRAQKWSLSLGFPPSKMSRRVIDRWQNDFPDASLVTHWPHYLVEGARSWVFENRYRRESTSLPKRLVAEVHSSMALLTAEELIHWRDINSEDRRLAIIGPGDPRIEEHDLDPSHEARLMRAVAPYASVVYLKFGSLTLKGDEVMNRGQVEHAVCVEDLNNPFADEIRRLSGVVGSQVEGEVNWVVNVRGSEESAKEQLAYVKKVFATEGLK